MRASRRLLGASVRAGIIAVAAAGALSAQSDSAWTVTSAMDIVTDQRRTVATLLSRNTLAPGGGAQRRARLLIRCRDASLDVLIAVDTAFSSGRNSIARVSLRWDDEALYTEIWDATKTLSVLAARRPTTTVALLERSRMLRLRYPVETGESPGVLFAVPVIPDAVLTTLERDCHLPPADVRRRMRAQDKLVNVI